jgi:hypothetical protein
MNESEMRVELDEELGCLKCPLCGDIYTHQGNIEVFNRDAEDSKTGTHIVINSITDEIVINKSMERNPSKRRQGIRLLFSCEGCEGSTGYQGVALEIAQHKGNTYLKWVKI